ncbi:Protease 2 [compost metagenome]
MAATEELQKKLFEEMKGRIKQDDQSVPFKDKGFWYYTRFEKGKDYAYYCRNIETGMNPTSEEILVNGPELATGHDYWALGGYSVSDDNKLLAFGIDTVSRRIYTVYFKDIASGAILQDKLEGTSGGVTWANDNKTVFYTKKDPVTLRDNTVWKHKLGTPQSADVMVFDEKDDTFSTGVFKTKSDKYLMIGSWQTLSTEYRVLDANNPDGEWRVIQPRERNHEYNVEHYGDKFYIITNLDAKNFRLMECPVDKTTKENWKEVIPHRSDVLLENIDIFKNYYVVSERKNGLTQLRIIKWADKSEYYLPFQDQAYLAYTSVNREFDTDVLRYGYTSLTTPNSIYDYNMATKERILLKQQEVVGGYNPDDYVSERLYATAKDGTKIPISLVYKKGWKKDGKAPLLLYAYGSYGNSMDPGFSSNRLSLLDRGFAYALAHIRGGQELGRDWYENGKLLKKKNTFTDFIDCGDFLVAQKYTSKEKLFAMGGSAGGLLMGAVTNMRPDLWKGVVAAVPFVDVVTTMLDESIPLTTGEFDEWGNPNDKVYYDYMKSYSPYDNVEKKNYPNMIVTTGYWDSQVQYWEPAKWVAKLRELKTDKNLLLLHTNMEAGHGGKSGRFEALKEIALEYAFMLNLAGITN